MNDGFGHSVAWAGDVNADGYDDVLVGAPHASSETGRAYLYLGGPGAAFDGAPDATLTGAPGEVFGIAVASAGDVNGDGYDDVLVGACYGGPTANGVVYVFLVASDGTLDTSPSAAIPAEATLGQNGPSVASAGDVNADGYDDVLIGAPGDETVGLVDSGSVSLYLGGAGSAFDATPDATVWGPTSNGFFGISVSSGGDFNADGHDDVLIGFPGDGAGAGATYLYLGSPAGTLGAMPDAIFAGGASDGQGRCVASAGDVNADGYDDVVVGAPNYGNQAGRARVYLGGPGTPNASPDGTLVAPVPIPLLYFGWAVAGSGDVNGDGYDDVIVGEPLWTAGAALVYLGGPSGTFDGTSDATLLGESFGTSEDENFGWSVASLEACWTHESTRFPSDLTQVRFPPQT